MPPDGTESRVKRRAASTCRHPVGAAARPCAAGIRGDRRPAGTAGRWAGSDLAVRQHCAQSRSAIRPRRPGWPTPSSSCRCRCPAGSAGAVLGRSLGGRPGGAPARFVSGSPAPRYDDILQAADVAARGAGGGAGATVSAGAHRPVQLGGPGLLGRDRRRRRLDRLRARRQAVRRACRWPATRRRAAARSCMATCTATCCSPAPHRRPSWTSRRTGGPRPGRPAVIAVDALAWGGAPIELLADWNRVAAVAAVAAPCAAVPAGHQPCPSAERAEQHRHDAVHRRADRAVPGLIATDPAALGRPSASSGTNPAVGTNRPARKSTSSCRDPLELDPGGSPRT